MRDGRLNLGKGSPRPEADSIEHIARRLYANEEVYREQSHAKRAEPKPEVIH